MKTLELTATQVRNDFFKILNEVIYLDTSVLVRKAGTDKMAMISPLSSDLEKRKLAMSRIDKIREKTKIKKSELDELVRMSRKELEDRGRIL